MPVEQPTYIDTLVPEWPLGSDPQSAGDDHIRMIKQVLQNTFPNIGGRVDIAHVGLNYLNVGWAYQPSEGQPADMVNLWKARDIVANDGSLMGIMCKSASTAQFKANPDLALTFRALMNVVYPVGHVIVTKKTGNPADWLGFGTWVQRVGFLAGAGSITDGAGMAGTIAVGEHKGNWRIQESMIVESDANWDLATSSTGRHRHEMPYNASDQEGGVTIQGSSSASSGNLSTKMSEAPDHSHDVTGTIKFGAGTATSGTQYTPPRHAFNVWERTV